MLNRSEGKELLMRLMSATSLRRDVLANNIASQNVPGYRRRDVDFEDMLVKALNEGESAKGLNEVTAEIVTDFESEIRADGNSVSPEQEASLLTENRLRFELYAAILRGRSSLITQAITADR